MKSFIVVLSMIVFSLSSLANQRRARITQLKEAQTSNNNEIEKLRHDIQADLNRLASLPFRPNNEKLARSNVRAMQSKIQQKVERLKQCYNQVDFWDRLVFETERKYTNGNYKEFLETTLLGLAKQEAMSPKADANLWKTFASASWSVKNACEQQEDPVSCLSSHLAEVKGKAKIIDSPETPLKPQAHLKMDEVLRKMQKSMPSLKSGRLFSEQMH